MPDLYRAVVRPHAVAGGQDDRPGRRVDERPGAGAAHQRDRVLAHLHGVVRPVVAVDRREIERGAALVWGRAPERLPADVGKGRGDVVAAGGDPGTRQGRQQDARVDQ